MRKRKGPICPYMLESSSPHILYANWYCHPHTRSHRLSTRIPPHSLRATPLAKVMEKVIKLLTLLLLLAFIFTFSQAESIFSQPQPQSSFKLQDTQNNVGSCSYTVSITTSCSSPRYTRDQISLSFGDAYGNQVYAPRLDDPSTRTFERCSRDTFDIYGPCTYQICYLYLYRSGYDGWKPDTVQVYGYNTKSVSFYYNTFIPSDVWFGFNLCSGVSSALSTSS